MRKFVILVVVSLSLSVHGRTIAHDWLKKIQNVFIETLPVNRVYIIEEHRVFSFELPLEFVNFDDTTVMCDLARCLGYSARPFWNTRRMLGDLSRVCLESQK